MSKWIVITTINEPNEAIRQFSMLPGWECVVVGDERSPKDWQLDQVHYLSLESQRNLGFLTVSALRTSHYSRKNIGYLYAIQKGAKLIWESDDDNFPITPVKYPLDEFSEISGLTSEDYAINPYPYFGAVGTWPRGFPLTRIHSNYPVNLSKPKTVRIPVQQSLANGQPDVDALFRLISDDHFSFQASKEPVYLPRQKLSPFNSQNTFWHESAFWCLLLPSTVSMRICDIWRGYIAQRLLWEIDGLLAFLPPCVVQNRNEHDLISDLKEEFAMYANTDNLAKTLLEWRPSGSTTAQYLVDLFSFLVEKKFLEKADTRLATSWITDLETIGYNFPSPSNLL